MNNCFWNYKTIVPGTARPITISSGKFMFHNKCFSDHLLGVGGVGGGGWSRFLHSDFWEILGDLLSF